MRCAVIGIVLAGFAVATFLSSCASTSLQTSWVEPEAKGKKLGNVLVVGIGKNAVVRRQFEDTFVRSLKNRQVGALASYTQLADPAAITEATVKPVVQKEKLTHVLIVRLVDRKTVRTYVPPTTYYGGPYPAYYGSWHGYYSTGYAAVSPGYTYDTEYVNLETNIYDAATDKLIWSGLTETALGSQIQDQIEEFIEVISRALAEVKLI